MPFSCLLASRQRVVQVGHRPRLDSSVNLFFFEAHNRGEITVDNHHP
jgi:hypothetical protein